jgi:hypothetical protein
LGEILAVSLPKRSHQRVTALLADLAVVVTTPLIEADTALILLGHVCFSRTP